MEVDADATVNAPQIVQHSGNHSIVCPEPHSFETLRLAVSSDYSFTYHPCTCAGRAPPTRGDSATSLPGGHIHLQHAAAAYSNIGGAHCCPRISIPTFLADCYPGRALVRAGELCSVAGR
eukprot:1150478-Pelagomonas_calceolata.AAC.3